MAIERGFALELVNEVIANLRDSPKELSACALVCREWLPLARSHTFHTIRFNQQQMAKLDRTVTRFVSLTEQHPHLTPFVRSVSITSALSLAGWLFRNVDFSSLARLETISLNFMSWVRLPSPDVTKNIQTIFELPSLKHLVLYSPVFEDIEQFAQFFDKAQSNIESLTFIDASFVQAKDLTKCMGLYPLGDRTRASLQSLALVRGSIGHIVPWLLHPQCPFDLSTLTCLKFQGEDAFPSLVNMSKVVSPTLRSLELWSPTRLINSEDIDIGPTVLPNLVHLTINNVRIESLPSAVMLLSQLTSANFLESITLVIDMSKSPVQNKDEDTPWKRMDKTLDHVQNLKSVDIIVRNKREEREHAKKILRDSFESMARRHVLRVC